MKLRLPDPPLRLPANTFGGHGGALRAWNSGDTSALVDAWHDPEVARYNAVPAEPSEATARRWIEGCGARLASVLSLDLVVIANRHDPLIQTPVAGEVGLSAIDPARREADIGYWLFPDARGQGLATAAVHTVVLWAAEELGLRSVVARCDPINVASQRVAARAGFAHTSNDVEGNQLWTCQPHRS